MILRSSSKVFASLFIVLLHTLFFSSPSLAKKDAPSISKYKFDHAPAAPPLYFDDSDVILVLDISGNVLRSPNAGIDWSKIEDVPSGGAWDLVLHPYDKKAAYLWGKQDTHWMSADQGESWRSFKIPGYPVPFRSPFSFHANKPESVIVNVCTELFVCNEMALYTEDAFKTSAKELRSDTRACVFARSTPLFQTSDDDKEDNRIVCVVRGRYANNWNSKDNRLAVSDDYFDTEEEPVLEAGRTVQGIINIAVVKGFLVAAASARGTDELAMYVTDDAKTWHRAVFPADHKLEQDAYTILESTNYSIQVDVMTTTPINAMGVLFSSNSNGTYFTRNIEHTNRNYKGIVDFEKVQGIQGIVMVNVVDNWEEVEKNPLASKKLKSKISFDDGRTFQSLTADGDEIHLHSVSDMSNSGRVFSSPAPGLVMGIGNKGKYLKDYEECDLWVSDTAGARWTRALKEAQKYEFGDRGAVLVAIYDEGPTDTVSYSINHGHKWHDVKLDNKVRAKILTTTPDSTSLKFFLMATIGGGEDIEHWAIAIDFAELHEGKCGKDDFEKWYARQDEDGNPTCIMGQKQYYRRRKWDADCFVDKEFEDPIPQFEPCACQKEDFECDYNFVPSDNGEKCTPSGAVPLPRECKSPDDRFMGSSGFRKIPGNECMRDAEGAVEFDKDVERPCDEGYKAPASGEISNEITTFRAKTFEEFFYLERTDLSKGQDETVVFRTDEKEVFISRDAGKTWDQILKGEEITAIYPHQYFNDVVFFLTPGKTVFYTVNRGQTIGEFKAPADPTRNRRLQILGFHPDYKDWLIWTGSVDDHEVAFFSEDRGGNWEHRLRYVNKCEFIKEEGRGGEEKLVYCEQYKDEKLDSPLQLKWSDNWFADDHDVFEDIIDFATMSEFIVVAARQPEDRDSLSCHTSVDGKTFANAQFPPTFTVPTQKAYTVLDSSTHAVFLHVTVNNREGSEFGSVIKSNSNGTSYVMSLNGVNRNERGYVDFEKMLGLEGVILVNQVANIDEAEKGMSKALRTMITHNDGAQWAPLQAPFKDAEGHDFGCDPKDISRCSLHLHSYTERRDPRATFSSPSAVGLMMAVGNVGESLGRKPEADTFITRDGGVQWSAVKKGNYMWEYGDQGSIIVIVEEDTATQSVFYTLNEGKDWVEYHFADKDFTVAAISTVPSDKSRNFILWGKESGSGSKIATVNLDFTGLADKQCELDEADPEAGDYYLWEPKHPNQKDNCLFGHVAQYHRKRPEAECFNGLGIERLHNIARNCSCMREDFEWYDYLYPPHVDRCMLMDSQRLQLPSGNRRLLPTRPRSPPTRPRTTMPRQPSPEILLPPNGLPPPPSRHLQRRLRTRIRSRSAAVPKPRGRLGTRAAQKEPWRFLVLYSRFRLTGFRCWGCRLLGLEELGWEIRTYTAWGGRERECV